MRKFFIGLNIALCVGNMVVWVVTGQTVNYVVALAGALVAAVLIWRGK